MNYISLNKSEIPNILFKDARFFYYAEKNAMGRPGEVEICLKNLDIYTFSYVYEDISFLDFDKHFPEIVECEYGITGFEKMEMSGWRNI